MLPVVTVFIKPIATPIMAVFQPRLNTLMRW